MRWAIRALTGVAVLLVAGAAWTGLRAAWFIATAERLEGEVVRIEEDRDLDSRVGHRAVIRFVDARGEPQEWPGRPENTASSHAVGDRVVLLRGGDGPRIALDAFGSFWTLPIALLVLAWFLGGCAWIYHLSEVGGAGWRLGSACVLLFGLPMFVGGLAAAAVDGTALARGRHAIGSVVNGQGIPWTLIKEGPASGMLPAVVRLRADDGRVVEFTDIAFNAKFVAAGAEVPVVYPPGRPAAGRVYAFAEYWLPTIILLGLGSAMSGVGLWLRRRARAG